MTTPVLLGFLKAAGVKRLGRLLASAVKHEAPGITEAVGRAAQKVTRRGARLADSKNLMFHSHGVSMSEQDRAMRYATREVPRLTGRVRGFHGTSQRGASGAIGAGILPHAQTGVHGGNIPGGGFDKRRVFLAPGRREAEYYGQIAGGGKTPPVLSVHAKVHGPDAMKYTRRYAGREIVSRSVPTSFIEGAKDFSPMTGREVVEHAKEHPEAVRSGLRSLTRKP